MGWQEHCSAVLWARRGIRHLLGGWRRICLLPVLCDNCVLVCCDRVCNITPHSNLAAEPCWNRLFLLCMCSQWLWEWSRFMCASLAVSVESFDRISAWFQQPLGSINKGWVGFCPPCAEGLLQWGSSDKTHHILPLGRCLLVVELLPWLQVLLCCASSAWLCGILSDTAARCPHSCPVLMWHLYNVLWALHCPPEEEDCS